MAGPIACISDIHANIEALLAVEKDLSGLNSPLTICFGDVVGYGPNPIECCNWLRERQIPCIQGNHDEAIVLGEKSRVLSEFNRFAKFSAMWTREQLGLDTFFLPEPKPRDEANLAWLAELPLIMAYDEWPGLEGTMSCHASLIEPEHFHYIEVIDKNSGQVSVPETLAHAGRIFEALDAYYPGRKTLFTGHYHTPCFFWRGDEGPGRCIVTPEELAGHDIACELDEHGKLDVQRRPLEDGNSRGNGKSYVHFRLDAAKFKGPLIINPGSVGQPRDGIADAAYMIYIPDVRRMIWRRVPYDMEATAKKILASNGLPEPLAERLKRGR